MKSLKLTVTILLLAFMVGSSGLVYGYLASEYQLPPDSTLSEYLSKPTESTSTQSNRNPGNRVKKRFNQLQGVGYLGGVEESSSTGGITKHQPEESYSGLNLYVSGHAPEAYLMDMKGNILHRWEMTFKEAFPNHIDGLGLPDSASKKSHWRKVHLLEDGQLLAIFAENGIVKLDKHSNLIWARYNYAHHDVTVGPDGNIYTVTRNLQVPKWRNQANPIFEDVISVLDPENGYQIREHSIVQAFLRTKDQHLRTRTRNRAPPAGDVFHNNTVNVYAGDNPRLPDGLSGKGPFALVSPLMLNTVGLIDLRTNRLKWGLTSKTQDQHDPRLLKNGNLLIFDNDAPNGYSRVIEIHPETRTIVWKYNGNEQNGFRTSCCGSSQRLPNGNTLITGTDNGRAFEVTRNGQVVWEFRSPHRTSNDSGKNDLVARLFHLERIEPERVRSWLDSN